MAAADHRTFPMPVFPIGRRGWMWCRWCGEAIPKVINGKSSTQRLWHPDCKEAWFLHTDVGTQFQHLAERDGERCHFPGCGAAPERWHRGDKIVSMAISREPRSSWEREAARIYWRRPDKPWAEMTTEDRMTGEWREIRRVTALEVDHRIPLWSVRDLPVAERRRFYGPDNLWLLCPVHHKAKTAEEAAQRAAIARSIKQPDLL